MDFPHKSYTMAAQRRPLIIDSGFIQLFLHIKNILFAVLQHGIQAADYCHRKMTSRYFPRTYTSRRQSSAIPNIKLTIVLWIWLSMYLYSLLTKIGVFRFAADLSLRQNSYLIKPIYGASTISIISQTSHLRAVQIFSIISVFTFSFLPSIVTDAALIPANRCKSFFHILVNQQFP